MSKSELLKKADELLSRNGFSYDGTPKKKFSKRQKYFEKRTVIMTPMGNGQR